MALIEGVVLVRTLGEFEQVVRASPERDVRYQTVVGDRPTTFRDLDEGDYTLCLFSPPPNIRVSGNNYRTWEATRRMQARCKQVKVTGAEEIVDGP